MEEQSSWSKVLKAGLTITAVIAATAAVVSNIDKIEKVKEEVKGYIQKFKKSKAEAPAECTPKREFDSFYCPISQQIMDDPVMTPYGHCFDRQCIEQWLDKNKVCPLTMKPLCKKDLMPCYSLKSAIEEYRRTAN